MFDVFQTLPTGGKFAVIVCLFITACALYLLFLISSAPLMDDDGNIIYEDIDDQTRAEAARKERARAQATTGRSP